MSDDAPLTLRREGPVVRAIMDRPQRRNALSEAMGAAWDALLAELKADKDKAKKQGQWQGRTGKGE